MLLTFFLTIVFSASVAVMLLAAVAFIQERKFFSSAPKEIQSLIKDRPQELFTGARAIGWTLFILSALMALGAVIIAIWDGIRSDYTFGQFFCRFLIILTVYKLCDMVLTFGRGAAAPSPIFTSPAEDRMAGTASEHPKVSEARTA